MFLNPSVRMAILRLVSEVRAKGSKPLWWKRLPITLFFVVVLLVVSGDALLLMESRGDGTTTTNIVLLGGILLIFALVVAVMAFVVALVYLIGRKPERTVDQKLPDEPLG